MTALYPSLIAAPLLDLEQEIAQLAPYCQGFHLDMMDNLFVPNTGMSSSTVYAIAKVAQKPIWVHAMVKKPTLLIESLALEPGSMISFHIECDEEILTLIKFIREKNFKPSIAINPKTPVSEVFPFLDKVDQVLIMSVDPGFSGQQFIPTVMSKLDPLVSYRQMNNLNFRIGMDGGITAHTIKDVVSRGVDDVVLGSALFSNPDPVAMLKRLNAYLL